MPGRFLLFLSCRESLSGFLLSCRRHALGIRGSRTASATVATARASLANISCKINLREFWIRAANDNPLFILRGGRVNPVSKTARKSTAVFRREIANFAKVSAVVCYATCVFTAGGVTARYMLSEGEKNWGTPDVSLSSPIHHLATQRWILH